MLHFLCKSQTLCRLSQYARLQGVQLHVPLRPRRYGIGQVYLRQEKWAEAHYHFRTAAAINKRSSVLHCYTGMALHRQGLHAEALQCLQVRGGSPARAAADFTYHPPAKHAEAAVLQVCVWCKWCPLLERAAQLVGHTLQLRLPACSSAPLRCAACRTRSRWMPRTRWRASSGRRCWRIRAACRRRCTS